MTKTTAQKVAADLKMRIDAAIADKQIAGESDNKRRRHLGASAIGTECDRERWYDFHWASKVHFEGRMLRLFDRGHHEEHRFLEWFGNIGIEYQRVDESTGRQFGFKSPDGHFAGSCDGRLRNVPGIEALGLPADAWIMAEFKTHNSGSFVHLLNNGPVQNAKPRHYIQAITYMDKIGFPLTLYVAVNKNDDDIYFEFIAPNPEQVAGFAPKIHEAIYARKPPNRISRSPSWHICKMCDHRQSCHFGHPMLKNCRTCVFSQPVDGGRWHCNKWNALIPVDVEPVGCDAWKQIED